MKLELLENKKVLILGLGREGESSFRFLRKYFPNQIIGLADELTFNKLPANMRRLIEKDKKRKLYLGKDYLKSIKNYDIIIKTPGIARKLLLSHITNQKITSQTEIFLEKHRDQTIGIAGTKGKGTTANLIYKILKDNGRKVKLIGNIGKPVLDYFGSDNIFVFEISSHQLENLKINPHIAVLLNIYSDHLDYFENFKQYFEAEINISKWQKSNDYFIFNNDFPAIKKIAQKSAAKTIAFGQKNSSDYFACNTLAAQAVASLFEIFPREIKQSIRDCENTEHRLEFIGKFKGVSFYNDSAATIPEATMAALNFLEKVETLILGGSKKKSDFKALANIVLKKRIKTVILFPKEGERIWQEISEQAYLCGEHGKELLPQYFFVTKMKEAVRLCFQHSQKGDNCLLSPSCASFSTFKNYRDRGEQFKKYVREIAKK